MTAFDGDPIGFLEQRTPWLFEPKLGTCVVGSFALQLSCRAAGIAGPEPCDLDLSWILEPADGRALLEQHGVFLATTEGNLARGTLAMSVDGHRIEITTLRGSASSRLDERIAADLAERDMTIGGLAVELVSRTIHDPHGGLSDWRRRRIAPIGDPAERVREHPIRWLRYFRKAHEWGFELDGAVRSLRLDPGLLHGLPPEAVAAELRAIFTACASPGRCLLELHEAGLLETLSPELARQFDGRPAGPQRWHPEVSQALHLILALEWAVEHSRKLDVRDQLAVRIAVLTHDFGKSYTPADELPSHRGHEGDGVRYVERFLDRWPGLADARTRMLSRHVCELHFVVRKFDELRSGTLAKLYEERFRPQDYPVGLFALAIAADTAGRIGREDSGEVVRADIAERLEWLRRVCGEVDAKTLRANHPDDVEEFRRLLHEARARAISSARESGPTSRADEAQP